MSSPPTGSTMRATARHAANYLSATGAQKLLAVVALPVYTHLMTTSEYGIVGAFTATAGLASTIATLNAHAAVGRYYYEDTDDVREFVGSSLALASACLILVAMCTLPFPHALARLLALPPEAAVLVLPVAAALLLQNVFFQLNSARKESGLLARVGIARSYSQFGVAVAVILALKSRRYMGPITAHVLLG
ncbi:MAG: oligosaccharide flippase family protein, partial [Elusimicrobia bacterium]|nr:oligosaccharide flippase family protein [Elusimicrobiota bacterium]